MSLVLTTIHKEQIKDDLAQHIPQREIADKFGVTQGRIHQIKKASEEDIELREQQIIDKLPAVAEIIETDIDTNKKISLDLNKDYTTVRSETISLKTVLDKTSVNVLKIAGILKTQALMNFSQYNQDNRQVNIEPSVMGLFRSDVGKSMQAIDMNEVSDSNDDSDNVDNP